MKIIVFEGWLMGRDSYVSAMLRSIGVKDFKGYAFNEVAKRGAGEQVCFLGHSLGGHAALKQALPGDLVITFDPRQQSVGSYFDSIFRYEMPFTSPKGVKAYNFFRRGIFLPGQRVIGAGNVELSMWTSHFFVPEKAASSVKNILWTA